MSNLQNLISNLISGNDEAAEAAAGEIAAFGADSLPALRELLSSENADHRWWATRTLALISEPQSSALLLESLRDLELEVRQCAALALKEQPTPEAIPALIATLGDQDQLLSRLAADALIAVGTESVPSLIEILKNGKQPAQGAAARVLAIIADTSAIPVMFDVWEGGSSIVQYWIEEGFRRMGVGMTFFNPE
ncbi:MAG: HEAT repeat domain-containing protein [Anaerolineales bacterium]|nr:HEAT repeat domain-containing protein [Anaerolineales bacterium]